MTTIVAPQIQSKAVSLNFVLIRHQWHSTGNSATVIATAVSVIAVTIIFGAAFTIFRIYHKKKLRREFSARYSVNDSDLSRSPSTSPLSTASSSPDPSRFDSIRKTIQDGTGTLARSISSVFSNTENDEVQIERAPNMELQTRAGKFVVEM